MKLSNLLPVLSLFLMLNACKKKDEQKPIITSLNYSFSNNDSLFAGGTLLVDVTIEDDLSLGGVKIKLKQQISTFAYKTYGYQETSSVLSIANKTFGGQFVFPIKDSTLAAPYQIVVEAFDKEGNQAEPVSADVYIYTVKMPKINVDSLSMAIQDTNIFVPKGSISAYLGLKKITAEIKKDGASIYSKSWDYVTPKFNWSLDSIGEVMMDSNFSNADLLLKATDNIGNNSYKRVGIRP